MGLNIKTLPELGKDFFEPAWTPLSATIIMANLHRPILHNYKSYRTDFVVEAGKTTTGGLRLNSVNLRQTV